MPPMNFDKNVEKELSKVDCRVDNKGKRVRDACAMEGHDLNEENASNNKSLINGCDAVSHARASLQLQQIQNSMVWWDRFLHLRSLKVLLVENDDSTRNVVAALLRNCSYEVTEAANGFQAWKILEDLTYNIDLILTEVVMPGLSGFGLLCKITGHDTRKTVPVIMMSSHDSMNLVFNCLSHGAVDFLVKPIRKNELKNLWQHVWRKCHSSSGSASESGTQTKKYVKSKNNEICDDNNSGRNDEDGNESLGVNSVDESDTESDIQSHRRKQFDEVDSLRPTCPVAKCHDNARAKDIVSKSGTFLVSINATRKHLEQKDGMLKPRNLNLEKIASRHLDINEEPSSIKEDCKVTNLTCIITNTTGTPTENTAFEASKNACRILEINDKANSDTKETFYLDLRRPESLPFPRLGGDAIEREAALIKFRRKRKKRCF